MSGDTKVACAAQGKSRLAAIGDINFGVCLIEHFSSFLLRFFLYTVNYTAVRQLRQEFFSREPGDRR
jgi:hypothetical protein